ncbi:MAG: hypothetical protein Fur0041_19560 [Bacteroidia bacterium]
MRFYAVISLCVLLLFTSCGIKPVVPVGVKQVKFNSINPMTGDVVMDLGLILNNPNSFAVTIYKMDMDVKVAGVPLGKIEVNDKIRIKRKREDLYNVKLNAKLINLITGLPKLLEAISKKAANVEVNGSVKVGALGMRHEFPIELKQKQVETEQEKK